MTFKVSSAAFSALASLAVAEAGLSEARLSGGEAEQPPSSYATSAHTVSTLLTQLSRFSLTRIKERENIPTAKLQLMLAHTWKNLLAFNGVFFGP